MRYTYRLGKQIARSSVEAVREQPRQPHRLAKRLLCSDTFTKRRNFHRSMLLQNASGMAWWSVETRWLLRAQTHSRSTFFAKSFIISTN